MIALDLNPSQLACLELRVAAYRTLTHPELLELIGSVSSRRRPEIYARCRPLLSADARAFWDAHRADLAAGVGGAGKFERYFRLFRTYVLPLVHSRRTVEDLLRGGPPEVRQCFHARRWDAWPLAADVPAILLALRDGPARPRPGLLQVRRGRRGRPHPPPRRPGPDAARSGGQPVPALGPDRTALWPLRCRSRPGPENFGSRDLRAHLDRLDWRLQSVEDYLDGNPDVVVDRYNLSDIFEYMSPESYERLLSRLAGRSRPGGRLAYWNMLAPRSRPESLADRLRPLTELAERLFAADKAAFYSRFVVEEVV